MSRVDMDKEEIQRQLEHQRKLLAVWRGHTEHVELQIAKAGPDPSSKLIQELREYQEQIKEVEARINILGVQAVEENISAAEAEYSVVAAEAWNSGYLSTLGAAQLELARLRLKIQPSRAAEIEQKIRSSIVDDLFRTFNIDLLFNIQGPISGNTGTITVNFTETSYNSGEIHMHLSQGWSIDQIIETNFINLGRCVLLDIDRIIVLIIHQIKEHHLSNIEYFKDALLKINKIDSFPSILPIYEKFIQEISNQLPSI